MASICPIFPDDSQGLKAESPMLKKGIALCRKLRGKAVKGTLKSWDSELAEVRRIASGVPPI